MRTKGPIFAVTLLGIAGMAAIGCARAVGSSGGGGGISDGGVGGNGASDLAVGGGGSGGGGAGGAGGGGGGAGGSGGVGGGGGGGGAGGGGGGGGADMAMPPDMASSGGLITGGPCASGAAGATAIRVHWTNSGGTATVSYDAFGMPDRARQKVSVAPSSFNTSFTPQFVDIPLGGGGLLLDDSDFIDIELSGAGLSAIDHATLAISGRSYNTTASGSFSWQSFSDSGQTDTNFVSNAPPYQWYRADIADTVAAGDSGVLVRVRSGPSSDALVVSRLEICLAAH